MNNEPTQTQDKQDSRNKDFGNRFSPRKKFSHQNKGNHHHKAKQKFTKAPIDPKTAKNKAKTLESFKECRKHWPHIFNLLKVKPVSVGMRQELLADAKERGIKISNSSVYNGLFWLTSTVQYKEALVSLTNRYNSKGKAVGVVSEEEKAKAKEALDSINGRTKKIASIVVAKGLKKQNQSRNGRNGRNGRSQQQPSSRHSQNNNRSQSHQQRHSGNQAADTSRRHNGQNNSTSYRQQNNRNGIESNRQEGNHHHRQQRTAKITYRSSTQPRSFASSAPTSPANVAAKSISASDTE